MAPRFAVLALASLTPFAYGNARGLRPMAYGVAVIHIANGLLHIVGSVIIRRPVPGVWTAPALLASGGWLAWATAHLV
jgi:hypothetical protein